MEGRRLADLHAYVDDCLEPAERRAFETQMAEDPALRQRAARWRAQNRAICAAFDRTGARGFAVGPRFQAGDQIGKFRRSTTPGMRFAREGGESRSGAGVGAPPLSTWKSAPSLAVRAGLATLAVCLICAWAPRSPAPSVGFGEAGAAAFSAFAQPGSPPVEFANPDAAMARSWLTAQLGWPVHLPATPAEVSLVGARIAPGSGSAAAFLVYQGDRRRLGMLVQPLDAPPPTPLRLLRARGWNVAVWTSAGQGYVLVGDLDAASLRAIATAFVNAGYEPDLTAPERGS